MKPKRNPKHIKARPVPKGNRHQRERRFEMMSRIAFSEAESRAKFKAEIIHQGA